MMRFITKLSVLLLVLLSCSSLLAGPRYVRLVVGTREVALSPRAVLDDNTVYAPADVLKALGANFVEGKRKVTLLQGEETQEIELKNINGVPMVNMDDVTKLIDVERMWDDQTSTLRLLGKLTSVEFENGTLTARVTAPVGVSSTRLWKQPWKLSIDLAGTKVGTTTRTMSVGQGGVSQVRIGQFEDITARIVVDLGGKVPYKVITKGLSREIKVVIGKGSSYTPVRPTTVVAKPTPAVETKPAADEKPAENADPVKITEIIPEPDSDGLIRVRVKTSGRAVISTLQLKSPPRIAVDFKNATCELPEPEIAVDHPLVDTIRFGRVGDAARIVFDTPEKVNFYAEPDGSDVVLTLRQPMVIGGGKLSDQTVVIDAGHGGEDPGAGAGGVREKAINLALAQAVRDKLEAAGVRVVMTRDDDTFIPLKNRPAFADSYSGDIFVSIHCNALGSPKKESGIETYYSSKQAGSLQLANAIHRCAIDATGQVDRRVRLRPGLAVLRYSNVPAILIEAGFIDCTEDRGRLCDESWRDKFAEGVLNGLRLYVEGTIGAEEE